jgi:hypothetical protein
MDFLDLGSNLESAGSPPEVTSQLLNIPSIQMLSFQFADPESSANLWSA